MSGHTCLTFVATLAYAIVAPAAPILAQEPEQPNRTQQAYSALRAGDVSAAETGFRAALRENPRDIAAHVGLGQALAQLGRTEEALASHAEAVRLNPLSVDLRMPLATYLDQLARSEEAVAELRRCVAYAPGDPRPPLALAGVLQRIGRRHEARAYALTALGLAPDNPAAHQTLAELAEARESWSEAIAHYEAVVRLEPNLRPARLAHLNALNTAGRYDLARRTAEALLSRVPEDLDVRMVFASALEGLAEREAAIEQYRQVLTAAPTLAVAWGNMGWSQYGAGKLEDALESSRKAVELDSGLAYARFNLGLILATLGRWNEAETEYRAAAAAGTAEDLKAGISDVESALKRTPEHVHLKRARDLLLSLLASRNGR